MKTLTEPSSYIYLETVTFTANSQCHSTFMKSSYLVLSIWILSKSQNYMTNTSPGVTACTFHMQIFNLIFYLNQTAWIGFQHKFHSCLWVRTESRKIHPVRRMEMSCKMWSQAVTRAQWHKYLSHCSHSGSSSCSKCRLLPPWQQDKAFHHLVVLGIQPTFHGHYFHCMAWK